ncbi:twitchin [Trichonephila inaurata madagascariensis]|uniref:Twitchin n=1 Tax=Trichonephila inaurata madagascariensis TaxID=2747483 RepID=A0A8X6XZ24_9ARAC|nr:twitchin [Trichonephila inaurata madagascariensis]
MEKNLIEFSEDVPSVSPENGKSSEYPPEVVVHLQNRIVQTGCRTRLYCSIMGDPDPEIKWMKNGKTLPLSSRYLFSNLVEFGLYMDIFNAKSTDSGQYTCIATNCHGSTQTQAYLQVVGTEDPPDFPESYENRLITNERIRAFEKQLGDSQTTATHKKYSGPLSEDESSCDTETWSTFGEKCFRTKKNNNPPGSPIAPHILCYGQTWTILTWSSPMEGRGRFEYLVERRLINTDRWTEAGRTFNTLYTVHGLKKGRTYVFRISAGNSRGWSLPSILPQPIHAPPR